VANRSKAELEAEVAALNNVVDAISDVLGDDELTATRKVEAAQQQLDEFDEDE